VFTFFDREFNAEERKKWDTPADLDKEVEMS
jgi:hypothetical protein